MGNKPHEAAKAVLWRNVQALMEFHFGVKDRSNQNKLARETKIGLGTAARIKRAGESPEDPSSNSTGLEKIEQIAERFGVEMWQLLSPDFDPEDAKDRQRWRKLYTRLTHEERQKVFDMLELLKGADVDRT